MGCHSCIMSTIETSQVRKPDLRENCEHHLNPLNFGKCFDKFVLRAGTVSSCPMLASAWTYLFRLFTLVPSRKSVVTSSVIL